MRGVLLFAFNTDTLDYYKMAIATAKRANYFLNLPVSVVTDHTTDLAQYDYAFDNVFVVESDKSNTKGKKLWINKGRHQAYNLTPYDETLVLDTDYLINSDMLLKGFDLYDDFMCPNYTTFLLNADYGQEEISSISYPTLWATVMFFSKTQKTKELFECLRMVQDNYLHYVNLYNMINAMYRNDYALTIAHRIVNGHYEDKRDYMPWSLVHIASEIKVAKNSNIEFNTEYTLVKESNTGKGQYIVVKDTDFHCMNKETFMDIV